MPYENYHACLVNPNITQILGTQTRKHAGKTYQVRIGRAKGKTTGSAERSYLYPKGQWTAAQARAHCKSHGGRFEPATAKTQQFIEEENIFIFQKCGCEDNKKTDKKS